MDVPEADAFAADLMTGAEFKVVREFLGLPTRWLADRWGKPERTIQRYDSGDSPIPEWVRLAVEELEAHTGGVVTAAIEACRSAVDPEIVTYRTDREYRQHHPELDWPSSWHRAVVARVAQEVPGLVIEYWTPQSDSRG